MSEVLNERGKSIATIHDPEAFAQLLDTFEKKLKLYFRLLPPQDLSGAYIYGINENLHVNLKEVIKELRELREQLGDTRKNLYSFEDAK
jgi:hypothetical protein